MHDFVLDAVSDGFADGGIEIHAAFAILANLVYEAAVFAERLAFLKDSSILFVRDVDDVAGELKVGACFSIGIGETEEPFVFLHFISDIEFIEMDGGEIDELLSIECFLVCECAEQESAGIDENLYLETGELFQGSFPLSEEESREIIELPYRLAESRKTDVIVVIREFQNIGTDEGDRILRVMQDVLASHKDAPAPYCSFVLLGSRVNAMADIFSRRKLFWNVVERLALSPLTSTEIAEYVMRGFSMGGKVIDRELVQGVCNLFRNNVWHINHFFFICDCLSKGYISEITFKDALSCMVSVHEPGYQRIMDDLTSFQIRFLKAVLDGVVKFSTTDVIEKYALNSSANVKRVKDGYYRCLFQE